MYVHRNYPRGGPVEPPRRRRFRGQYIRRRSPPNGGYGGGASFSDDRNDSPPPPHHNRHMDKSPQYHHQHQQQQRQSPPSPPPPPSRQQRERTSRGPRHRPQQQQHYNNDNNNQYDEDHGGLQASKVEIKKYEDSMKSVQSELDTLKARVGQLSLQYEQLENNMKELNKQQSMTSSTGPQQKSTARSNDRDKRERQREKKAAKLAEKKSEQKILKANANSTNLDQNNDANANEPATTSSDKQADKNGEKEKARVLRKKRPPMKRRGAYANRRRRADSSERNSNDTSPQNELNGNEDESGGRRRRDGRRIKITYPELSKDQINEIVQTLNREFLGTEKPAGSIIKVISAKGPEVAYEFALSILDHAICNVTSPAKISEIATNLNQLLVSEEVEFRQGFYSALKNIASREHDIKIDAPRYMDTLGKILGECDALMLPKYKYLAKSFLTHCIDSYSQQNRAELLASIFRSIASFKDERFAKELWDLAKFNWSNLLRGVDKDEFLDSHQVKFTTIELTPVEKSKKTSEELEKFADDVTGQVEKPCQPQALIELIKEIDCSADEEVEVYGTFIYAVVRGCLVTDNGDYKLNPEALNKFTSVLNSKRPNQDAIVVRALSELTRLWHTYNCPKDLMTTILLALHQQGTASYDALTTYLNSESLNNIPGIGAARLNSKRSIEDLGAKLKS